MTGAAARRRVRVLSLGGTIAMTSDTGVGIVPRLDAAGLVDTVPGLHQLADLGLETFRSLPSSHLQLTDLLQLADRIRTLLAADSDAIVVTQGTDTIEETAYVLNLVLDVAAPVVVTGAMRGPQALGADGASNLAAAVRVAADPGAPGRGVLVVLNEVIHSARWATKTHTSRPDAFRSVGGGPFGAVTEGRVDWFWPPAPRISVPVTGLDVPQVLLVPSWLGDDGSLLRAALALRPAGVVLSAMGAGHVPPALIGPLEQAARQIPVVLCSRIGSGPVFRHTYGFAGSELDLLARGLLWGGALPGHKARIFLALTLAAGWSVDQIAAGLADAWLGWTA